MKQAASIGIIGGADGPTAIFVTGSIWPTVIGAIAVIAAVMIGIVVLCRKKK